MLGAISFALIIIFAGWLAGLYALNMNSIDNPKWPGIAFIFAVLAVVCGIGILGHVIITAFSNL